MLGRDGRCAHSGRRLWVWRGAWSFRHRHAFPSAVFVFCVHMVYILVAVFIQCGMRDFCKPFPQDIVSWVPILLTPFEFLLNEIPSRMSILFQAQFARRHPTHATSPMYLVMSDPYLLPTLGRMQPLASHYRKPCRPLPMKT